MRGRWRLWTTSVRGVFGRSRAERELADEFTFHLRERTDHWMARGLTQVDAARRARLEFGSVAAYQELSREAKGYRPLDELRADLRYAWRQLRAAPVLSVMAIAVLALAIGANTAIFSALNGTLWRQLPVVDPGPLRELAWLVQRDGYDLSYDGSMRSPGQGLLDATSFSYPVYRHLRDTSRAFSDVVLLDRHDQINLRVNGQASLVRGLLVSGNFFRGVGVPVAIGRPVTPEDDTEASPPVAVLTHEAWQRLFNGDRRVLGTVVTVNGAAASIVGVTPPGFFGIEPGRPVDLLAPVVPLAPAFYSQADVLTTPRRWGFRVLGRLAPGASDAQATSETMALVQQAITRDGVRLALEGVAIRDISRGLDSLRRNYGPQLRLLTGIASVVLLIACANVAGLLVTRAASRRREITIRLALGATTGRMARQMFTESLLLSALGGAAGTAAALTVRHQLLPLLNQDSEPLELALAVDWRLLLFSVAICAIVGVVCGVLPAVLARRQRLQPSMARAVGATDEHVPRLLAGKTLIAIQVGLSVVLLAGAGLLSRSLFNLRAEPLGFDADHVLLFEIDATLSRYEGTRLLDFYERALERLQAVPGVASASFSRYSLLSGGATTDGITVQGLGDVSVYIHFVAPRYFETMDIALRAGRDFGGADREGASRVAIVNAALAAALGPASPVGRLVHYGDKTDPDTEIVGVVADARYDTVREAMRPTLYLPYRQHSQHQMIFAARTAGDPLAIVPTVRQTLAELDPGTPLFHVMTQQELNNQAWRHEQIFATVVTATAALAVVLACLGIYGSLAYAVTERTQEIGLRIALGAYPQQVVRLILRESLTAVVAGTGIGLAGAVGATELIRSLLFGISDLDGPTFGAAVAAVVLCALFAAWLPSRRASRIDPVLALRRDT